MRREYNLITGETKDFPEYITDVEPVAPITQVTMKQARFALAEFGALSKVKKALAELPEPQQTLATVAWECSPTVSKDDILIQTLATLTGLTAEDVDNLFELAATK